MDDINRNSQLADDIGDKLYSDEFEEVYDTFTQEFGKLPEDFFSIGEESGTSFTNGFMDAYKLMFQEIQAEINALFSTKIPAAVWNGAMSAANTVTNTFYDNRQTTINAPDSSPRGIIEAEKRRADWESHTKKWGE